jgi:hypothetical protein
MCVINVQNQLYVEVVPVMYVMSELPLQLLNQLNYFVDISFSKIIFLRSSSVYFHKHL